MLLIKMPTDVSAFTLFKVPGLSLPNNVLFVASTSHLPAPSGGVITIPAGTTLIILGDLDLGGNRLSMGGNAVIKGYSSGVSIVRSTGLTASANLITTSSSLTLSNCTLGCPTNCSILSANGPGASDFIEMERVSFGSPAITCGTVGTIQDYNIVVLDYISFQANTGGLTFNGTLDSIAMTNMLFASSAQTAAYVTIPNTTTITRRVRISLSAVVTTGVGFNLAVTNTPTTSILLDNVNFSGGGTYVQNITASDNRAAFTNCIGIPNSASIASLRIVGNVSATTIATIGTYTAIVGTTTVTNNLRFNNTAACQFTYIGALTQRYYLNCTVSMSSGNNNQLGLTFLVNGGDAALYEKRVTTGGNGTLENVNVQAIVQLATNDTVQVRVANFTATNSITVTELSFLIFRIN